MDYAGADPLIKAIHKPRWEALPRTMNVGVCPNGRFPPIHEALAGKPGVLNVLGSLHHIPKLRPEIGTGIDLNDFRVLHHQLRPVTGRYVVGRSGYDAVSILLHRQKNPRSASDVAG